MIKRNIIFKFFIILLIFITLLPFWGNISLAIRAENPPPKTYDFPGDSGKGSSSTPIKKDTHAEKWVEETRYIGIDGNAYEISSNDSDSVQIPKKPVRGVVINDSMVTDENGHYQIKDIVGNYHIDFKYGDLNALNLDSSLTVKDILQYNGYDFRVQGLTNGTYVDDSRTTTQHEIIDSGKGAAQVYLVVDVSISMLDEVEINGVKQTKLHAVVEAAKTLIHSLIAGNDNIYIGIVIFAKKASRVAGVTRDEDFLNYALDKVEGLVETGGYYGTNIIKALDKAYDSFAVDESDPDWREHCNRNIILLSDGVATTDGNIELSSKESAEETHNKAFQIIGPNTIQKIKDIIADGVNIMSLLIDDPLFYEEGDDTHDYIDFIYKNNVNYYEVAKDEADLVQKIINDLKDWIKDQLQKDDRFTTDTIVITGQEDENRRKEVDNLFDYYFYYNFIDKNNPSNDANSYLSPRTVLFKEIDNNTRKITDNAKLFGDSTWMLVNGGDFVLEEPGVNYDTTVTQFCDICQKEHAFITHYVFNNTFYTQDLFLERRQEGILATKVTATALKLTLNTGKVLIFDKRDINNEKDSLKPLVGVLDDEVAHGATMEVEYTIQIKNNSSFQFNNISLVDYMPENLVYMEETNLLTSKGKNSDYGWSAVPLKSLYEAGFISKEAFEKYGNGEDSNTSSTQTPTTGPQAVVCTLDNEDKGEKGFYLRSGDSVTLQIVLSRVISVADDITGSIENDVEIIGYKNNANRRTAIARTTFAKKSTSNGIDNFAGNEDQTIIQDKPTLLGIYPGDIKIYQSDEISYLQEAYKDVGTGVDYALSSNPVFIVPPTGITSYENNPIEIGYCVPVLLIPIAFWIYKKKKSGQKK